jgi:hypothetical protein
MRQKEENKEFKITDEEYEMLEDIYEDDEEYGELLNIWLQDKAMRADFQYKYDRTKEMCGHLFFKLNLPKVRISSNNICEHRDSTGKKERIRIGFNSQVYNSFLGRFEHLVRNKVYKYSKSTQHYLNFRYGWYKEVGKNKAGEMCIGGMIEGATMNEDGNFPLHDDVIPLYGFANEEGRVNNTGRAVYREMYKKVDEYYFLTTVCLSEPGTYRFDLFYTDFDIILCPLNSWNPEFGMWKRHNCVDKIIIFNGIYFICNVNVDGNDNCLFKLDDALEYLFKSTEFSVLDTSAFETGILTVTTKVVEEDNDDELANIKTRMQVRPDWMFETVIEDFTSKRNEPCNFPLDIWVPSDPIDRVYRSGKEKKGLLASVSEIIGGVAECNFKTKELTNEERDLLAPLSTEQQQLLTEELMEDWTDYFLTNVHSDKHSLDYRWTRPIYEKNLKNELEEEITIYFAVSTDNVLYVGFDGRKMFLSNTTSFYYELKNVLPNLPRQRCLEIMSFLSRSVPQDDLKTQIMITVEKLKAYNELSQKRVKFDNISKVNRNLTDSLNRTVKRDKVNPNEIFKDPNVAAAAESMMSTRGLSIACSFGSTMTEGQNKELNFMLKNIAKNLDDVRPHDKQISITLKFNFLIRWSQDSVTVIPNMESETNVFKEIHSLANKILNEILENSEVPDFNKVRKTNRHEGKPIQTSLTNVESISKGLGQSVRR